MCWALGSIAEAAHELAAGDGVRPASGLLSPFFQGMMGGFIAAAERADASTGNLRSSAFEAIMSLVTSHPGDCYEALKQTFMWVAQKLQASLGQRAADRDELAAFSELQSLLCATLHTLLRNMHKEDVSQISATVMQQLLTIFQLQTGAQASVQEDALLALSSIVEALEGDFLPYLDATLPFLGACLQRKEEYEAFKIAVGVIGDLSRSVGAHLGPHVGAILPLLLSALSVRASLCLHVCVFL